MTNNNTVPVTTSSPARRWGWLLAGALVVGLSGMAGFWAGTRKAPNPQRDPGKEKTDDIDLSDGPSWFRDKTAHSGIDFTYRNGEEADRYTILESLGGGVAMIDFNGDGLLDLFFTGGGYFEGNQIKAHPCRLYQNLGDWKFRDVTAEVGLDKIDFYTHGCAVADYDCDGWPDLLITGYGRVALFRNEPSGSGRRFVETTVKAGLNESSWGTSAGFADLRGTGYPDLFICNYVNWSFANNPPCKGVNGNPETCGPKMFKPLQDKLYHNDGKGGFRDRSLSQKIRSDGAGLGVLLADLNGDGRPDIFVTNDVTPKHLYFNRDGSLEEKGLLAGVAFDDKGDVNGSMGVDLSDYDGSGRPSLFVSNFQNELHSLFQNLGKERFGFQSRVTGLAALGFQNVGWGSAFIDVDQDGWEDLVIVHGHLFRSPVASPRQQKPLWLRNVPSGGRRIFKDYSKQGGAFFSTPAIGRGLAVGDLDNDGWPDLVVSNTNSPAVLLRNEGSANNPARWLGIKLVGKNNRDVVGATLVLETTTRRLTRFTKGGGSYLSSSDRRILFGLGTSDLARRLTVRWPWGKEQIFENLEPNHYWELREGEPKAKRVPRGEKLS